MLEKSEKTSTTSKVVEIIRMISSLKPFESAQPITAT